MWARRHMACSRKASTCPNRTPSLSSGAASTAPKTSPRRPCGTCCSPSSDLWQYLMETRHRRSVTIESVSVWIPDVAAHGMWVSAGRRPGAGLPDQAGAARATGVAGARGALLRRPRPIPLAREALLSHVAGPAQPPRDRGLLRDRAERAAHRALRPERGARRRRRARLSAPRLISLDGSQGEGGGQIVRTALALSAVTGQGFEITRIRAGRTVPGLRPQHLAAVRAAALACGARVGGAFDGSPDLRFEPGPIAAGDFRFEIATAGAATLVLQTVLLPAGHRGAAEPRRGDGRHARPRAARPSTTWPATGAPVVARLGLVLTLDLAKAGFYPPGGGEAAGGGPALVPARVALAREAGRPRRHPRHVRGVAAQGRRGPEAARRGAGRALGARADSRPRGRWWRCPRPRRGRFLFLEAVFEEGRAAFGLPGGAGPAGRGRGRPGRPDAAEVPGRRRGGGGPAPGRPARGAAGPVRRRRDA